MKKQVIRLFVGALLALSCSACGAETADGGQAEANAKKESPEWCFE